MKYKFVKKGTEIGSESINGLMDFGQVMDKAAGLGMGTAPLAKGALGAKTVSLSKILWVLAVPFTVSVYFAVTELTADPVEVEAESPIEMETIQSPIQVVMPDSVQTVLVAEEQEAVDEEAAPAEVKEVEAVPAPVAEPTEPEEILIKEDIMIKAEPVDGFPAFYELIDRELTYPEAARISNIEGFVRVYFVVDKDGKAGKFRVVRSLGDEFDKEALRVMSKIQDWVPATHNGQPVSSHMSIKLRFELEKEEEN